MVSACDRPSDLQRAQEGAMVAAEVYYGYLLHGDYEQFLAGRRGMDSIPESFREQLLTTYRQFMAQQKQFRGGIVSIEASRAVADSTLNRMQVFLLLNYHDGTTEEVVVPMVLNGDQWLMR